MIAASDLTFYKLLAVINNPADTCLRKSGEFGIFLGPAHHAFGSVYMGYMGAGFGSRTCSTACVGKKVQNLHRAVGLLNDRREPVPVGSLLWEQTGVFEAEWL